MTEDKFKWDENNVTELLYHLSKKTNWVHSQMCKWAEDFKQSKLQSQDKPQPSSIDRIEVSTSTINFDKQVLNPYPTDSWKHAAWENGFMEAVNKYIKPTSIEPLINGK